MRAKEFTNKLQEGWGAEPAAARHREQMAATAKVLQKYKNDPFKSRLANYLFQNNWSGASIDKELTGPGSRTPDDWQLQMDKFEQNYKIGDWTDKMAADYLNDQNLDEEKRRLDPKCWKGYRKQGTKMKGDVRVNNCVKIKK